MPDFDAISEAIAARYAPGQVTPPAGFENVKVATADLPNAIAGALPVVYVFPDAGRFDSGGGSRLGHHDFLVRFYYAVSKDLERETAACRSWLTVLADQLRTGMQLGGLADSSRVESWRVGVLPYAGTSYSGVELGVHVVTTQGWSPTA